MTIKDRSTILISIFKRKGGEGNFTKIIQEEDLNKEHLIL